MVVKHRVPHPMHSVWALFTRDLFLALAPAWPRLQVHVFEGCYPGNRVELSLNFGLFQAEWKGRVTQQGESEQEIQFTDVALQPPLGLSYWQHTHRLIRLSEQETLLVEDIYLQGRNPLMTALLWLAFWGQMRLRGSAYRAYFRANV